MEAWEVFNKNVDKQSKYSTTKSNFPRLYTARSVVSKNAVFK